MLLAMLLTVGVLTPFMIWRAKLNLEKEVRAFECCKERIEKLKASLNKKDDDPYTVLMAHVKDSGEDNPMNSSADVQRYIYGPGKEQELNTGYASDRLYAIIASVNTKNLVRKTPSLGDLHELTVQRERGGISTAIFRVLAPCILVIGILGTLLGVHNKLDSISGELGVSVLADALIPGALAVFFTVLVMVLRGWYNKELSTFISDFDEYTLKTLLVIFQSESQDDADITKLIEVLKEVKRGKQTMEEILKGIKQSHEEAYESEKLCADLLSKTHENLADMSAVFGASINNRNLITQVRENTIKSLSAYLKLCSAYKDQLAIVQNWMNKTENVFCNIYEEVAYPGMEFINGMHNWQSSLAQLREYSDEIGVFVANEFSMIGIDESVEKLQKLVAFLDALPESVQQYKQDESVISSADDVIDTKIAEMAKLAEQLPDMYDKLHLRFETVKNDCAAFFAKYQAVQNEVVEKLRNFIISIQHMQQGGRCIYASGWRGLMQRVKDRMMKLRSFYRNPWGLAAVMLVLFLLVAWNIWMQL